MELKVSCDRQLLHRLYTVYCFISEKNFHSGLRATLYTYKQGKEQWNSAQSNETGKIHMDVHMDVGTWEKRRDLRLGLLICNI